MNRLKHSPPGWSIRVTTLTHGQFNVKIKRGDTVICQPEMSDYSAYGGLSPIEQGRKIAWGLHDAEEAEKRHLVEVANNLAWLIGEGRDLPMQDVFDTKTDVTSGYDLDREAGIYRRRKTVSGA